MVFTPFIRSTPKYQNTIYGFIMPCLNKIQLNAVQFLSARLFKPAIIDNIHMESVTNFLEVSSRLKMEVN